MKQIRIRPLLSILALAGFFWTSLALGEVAGILPPDTTRPPGSSLRPPHPAEILNPVAPHGTVDTNPVTGEQLEKPGEMSSRPQRDDSLSLAAKQVLGPHSIQI